MFGSVGLVRPPAADRDHPNVPSYLSSDLGEFSVARKRKSSQAQPTVDAAGFETALAALASLDAVFAAALRAAEAVPTLRRREPGFEGLASIIVAQQVSTASANAIFGRVKAHFDGAVEARALLATSDAELKLCGLSAPKIRALRAIAEAIGTGALDLAALSAMQAEAAHAALVAVKGIGPWTADVFLLFCLGHADAFPAGDLALQEAARIALGLPARPTTKELTALSERWRPLRGVAAHCLWAYYRTVRGRAATLEATEAETVPGKKLPIKTPAIKTPAKRKTKTA